MARPITNKTTISLAVASAAMIAVLTVGGVFWSTSSTASVERARMDERVAANERDLGRLDKALSESNTTMGQVRDALNQLVGRLDGAGP